MILYTHLNAKLGEVDSLSDVSKEKAQIKFKKIGNELLETMESLFLLLKDSETSINRAIIFKIANLILFEFFTDREKLFIEGEEDGKAVTTKARVLSEKIFSAKDRAAFIEYSRVLNDCAADLVAYSEDDSNPEGIKLHIEKNIARMKNAFGKLS